MDLTVIIILFVLQALLIKKYADNKFMRQDKTNSIIYNEARRASRLSLEGRISIEQLGSESYQRLNDIYISQTETIKILKKILGESTDVYDLSGENPPKSAKQLLAEIRIKQQAIENILNQIDSNDVGGM